MRSRRSIARRRTLRRREHIEGLPLGTRGGILIHHNFPLDGEYAFDVFLLRNIVGYMTGLEWPHDVEIAIDGERVFLATVGGKEDNAMSDANMSAAANAIDERLRTRVFVPAGPHDVTVTFIAKSEAETHEPLELHTRNLDLQDMNGLPVLDYVNIRGPFDAKGLGSTPSRERIFTCRPQSSADEIPCATEILSTLAHRAYRRPVTEQDIALLLRFFSDGRKRGTLRCGYRERAAVDPHEPELPVPRREGSARRRARNAVRGRRRVARFPAVVLPLERAARRRAARARRERQAARGAASTVRR